MRTWRQLSRASMSHRTAGVTAQGRRRGSFTPVRSRGATTRGRCTPVPNEAHKPLACHLVALSKMFLELRSLPQAAAPVHPQTPGSQKGISAQHWLP